MAFGRVTDEVRPHLLQLADAHERHVLVVAASICGRTPVGGRASPSMPRARPIGLRSSASGQQPLRDSMTRQQRRDLPRCPGLCTRRCLPGSARARARTVCLPRTSRRASVRSPTTGREFFISGRARPRGARGAVDAWDIASSTSRGWGSEGRPPCRCLWCAQAVTGLLSFVGDTVALSSLEYREARTFSSARVARRSQGWPLGPPFASCPRRARLQVKSARMRRRVSERIASRQRSTEGDDDLSCSVVRRTTVAGRRLAREERILRAPATPGHERARHVAKCASTSPCGGIPCAGTLPVKHQAPTGHPA